MDVLKEVSLFLHKSIMQVRQGETKVAQITTKTMNLTTLLPPTIRGMGLEKFTEVSMFLRKNLF
jgi:hypothetical protein